MYTPYDLCIEFEFSHFIHYNWFVVGYKSCSYISPCVSAQNLNHSIACSETPVEMDVRSSMMSDSPIPVSFIINLRWFFQDSPDPPRGHTWALMIITIPIIHGDGTVNGTGHWFQFLCQQRWSWSICRLSCILELRMSMAFRAADGSTLSCLSVSNL